MPHIGPLCRTFELVPTVDMSRLRAKIREQEAEIARLRAAIEDHRNHIWNPTTNRADEQLWAALDHQEIPTS